MSITVLSLRTEDILSGFQKIDTNELSSECKSVIETLSKVIHLVGEFEDLIVSHREQVWEGLATIKQQAKRFIEACDDATRADAAEWTHDGYWILSSGLPGDYQGRYRETALGWETAKKISLAFGGEDAWVAQVKRAYGAAV